MIYFIGLGSNRGERLRNLKQAKDRLAAYGSIEKQSSVYQSSPWGNADQSWFFNAVIKLRSNWRPFRLLRKLKTAETQMGRTVSERWGPRVIDLDILLWDGEKIEFSVLTVPHPYLEKRPFVVQPLAEIAPELILPSGLTAEAYFKHYFADERLQKIANKW